MKKISLLVLMVVALACNNNATNEATDKDHTDQNDTSAVPVGTNSHISDSASLQGSGSRTDSSK
jgi:hypothetical protein